MSELVQLVQQQNIMIQTLTRKVDELTILVMKNKVDDTWVSEDVAAEMLGYKSPRSLRNNVVEAKHPFSLIEFRHTNGRNYQYNRKSILKFKEKTSTMS